MDIAMGGTEEEVAPAAPAAEPLPADANETVYIKNLNEGVKLDGE